MHFPPNIRESAIIWNIAEIECMQFQATSYSTEYGLVLFTEENNLSSS